MILRISELDHLVLTVSDLKRSVAFYAGVLEMPELIRDPDGNLLEIANRPDE